MSRIGSTLVFIKRTFIAIHIIFVYIRKTILTFFLNPLISAASYNPLHILQISGQSVQFPMIFAVTEK